MPPGCGFLKRKNISAAYAVTVQLCLFCFKKIFAVALMTSLDAESRKKKLRCRIRVSEDRTHV